VSHLLCTVKAIELKISEDLGFSNSVNDEHEQQSL